MAENDIYDSEKRYKRFKDIYLDFAEPIVNPENRDKGKRQYFCRYKDNIKYFPILFKYFEFKDISYIRRLRLLNTFKVVCYVAQKDLSQCYREDISDMQIFVNNRYNSPKSRSDFVRDVKHMWKILFPEKDEKDRIDNTIVPYCVRHLSAKQDKSREKARKDKIYPEEYKRIVSYFSHDPRLQSFISHSVESEARPQELLFTRIKNYEWFDGFAKIHVEEHGKEGIKTLICFDSFPYVRAWFEKHPDRNNPNAFFYCNLSKKKAGLQQLKVHTINKALKQACRELKIGYEVDITDEVGNKKKKFEIKPLTCYSFKRAGITFDAMQGVPIQETQLKAGWTTTKQYSTYNKMAADDMINIKAIKAGKETNQKIIKRYEGIIGTQGLTQVKKCICGAECGFSEKICQVCKRPLDQKQTIENHIEENTQLNIKVKELTSKVNQLMIYQDNMERLHKYLPEIELLLKKKLLKQKIIN